MTEYDYSPEARERYIAKQHAIARWVSNTNRYEPANPFLPSEPSGSSYPKQASHLTERDGRDSNMEDDYSSRHYHHRDDRDRHQRPYLDRYDSHQSRSSSRQHSRSSSTRPSRRNTSHSYYPSQPPAHGQTYYSSPGGQQQNPYYDPTAHEPRGSESSTPPPSSQPRTPYEQSSRTPTLVPINGGAGAYVLVPPKGVSYRLVQPQSPPPTQPWLKRVFSPSLSETTGQKPSRSSSGGHGRRGSKWSWDIY